MMRIRISGNAGDDLDAIWLYVIRKSGIDRAQELIDSIVSKFSLLATHPGIGKNRDELRPELRSFPEGKFCIYYREHSECIEIVRILHGARDETKQFE
jgi:toxin ParE1/3/4